MIPVKILIIDNYDSFTYNLVQLFGGLGAQVEVVLNDQITLPQLQSRVFTHLCISPGPSNPANAGISCVAIAEFLGKKPILGICLGHQCLVQVLGGDIVRAEQIIHGRASDIYHQQDWPFDNMPNPFKAGRYHSLLAHPQNLPDPLKVIAWTENKEIMAVTHQNLPALGIQFHPESVLTALGEKLMKNYLLGKDFQKNMEVK